MDSRNGRMYELESEEQAERLKKLLGGALKEVICQEASKLNLFPQEKRPEELALMRFIEERKKLGAPTDAHVQNAFRLGYRAAVSEDK